MRVVHVETLLIEGRALSFVQLLPCWLPFISPVCIEIVAVRDANAGLSSVARCWLPLFLRRLDIELTCERVSRRLGQLVQMESLVDVRQQHHVFFKVAHCSKLSPLPPTLWQLIS